MDLSIDLRNQFCKKPEKSLRKVRSAISFSQRQIKFTLERFSDPSLICLRAQPLKNSAGRVPQAADGTCNNVGESNSRSNVFQVRRSSVCVPSR
jgi:hypothetical protein